MKEVLTILIVIEVFMIIKSLSAGRTWPWLVALFLTLVVIAGGNF